MSNDLGLVAVGGLAFLSAGHLPGIGEYGQAAERALSFVVKNAKPSGLLNIAGPQRDTYNHGLSTFVLGQAYGMTGDARIGKALDRALKLIARTQGPAGGWAYQARSEDGDLSLSVMQAKALRSAVDSGFEIPPSVIEKAIANVRQHYAPQEVPTQNRKFRIPFYFSGAQLLRGPTAPGPNAFFICCHCMHAAAPAREKTAKTSIRPAAVGEICQLRSIEL